ncbi:hypothetical protein [Streptomyces millisiae]|uniref:DUF4352 domain-containing protein n=1 Tax=Streptomyces millisiae TaxID=3075542 RepID=A0ABU2LX53_9ACTN|nr:hypothetical protein [Streptomyces sp. DSM 44918]MDT0321858.1 hypothetical protein [Streptomyces sp. DSM 44918]
MGDKQWTSVSKLSVVLQTGQHEASMRGVTTRKVGVVVSIQPTDNDGLPAPQDFETLYSSISLIDYVDEGEVATESGSGDGWHYVKDTKFKGTTNGDGTQQIRFIMNWTQTPDLPTRSFGAKVQIKNNTSSPVYYSSLNGSYHSSVMISTL